MNWIIQDSEKFKLQQILYFHSANFLQNGFQFYLMKKILIVLLFTTEFSFAQNPLVKQWDYRFGGTEHDCITSIIKTNDGGFVIGGSSESPLSGDKSQDCWGDYDYWIVKTDSLGIKKWDKRFGGLSYDGFRTIIQTFDGGFILGGTSSSDSSGDKTQYSQSEDYWIVKIDANGNKEWDKEYGGSSYEYLQNVVQAKDGSYTIGGYTNSGISGDVSQDIIGGIDYWMIKIDSEGNKIWDKRFGSLSNDLCRDMILDSYGNYLIGGFTSAEIGGDKTQTSWGDDDYWVLKIDSDGNKIWDKRFGGTWNDYLFSMAQTTDGNFILSGQSGSNLSGDKTQDSWGSNDYWIVKIDQFGNILWDKRFGGSGDDFKVNERVTQTLDGGYLISGASTSNMSGDKTEDNNAINQYKTWIVKTDSIGNKVWDKTIFTNGSDIDGLAIETTFGCYVIANACGADSGGYKTQDGWGSGDYWFAKFCDTTLQVRSIIKEFALFPNPATTQLTIQSSSIKTNESTTISIINVLGEMVMQQKVLWKGEATLDVKNLAQGIYLLRMENEKEKLAVRFVKE